MGTFVENNLIGDEKVVYRTQIHWFIYMNSFFWLLSALLIFIIGRYGIEIGSKTVEIFSGLCAFIAIYKFGDAAFLKQFTEIAITDKRMMAKTGFISRETCEIPLLKIEFVTIDQSIAERIVDSGRITIRGTGSGIAPISYVEQPVKFRNELNTAIANARSKYNQSGGQSYHGGAEQQ